MNFEDDKQLQLANLFFELNNKGYKQMLSNSDPKNINPKDEFFDDIYKDFNIKRVDVKRSINSNSNKRNSIKEIVVTNY